MNRTTLLLKQITERFAQNATEIGRIATSSTQQKVGILQITTAISELSATAEQLKSASDDLSTAVGDINHSQTILQNALK
jgi:methyl-accepting chemotaxis protein